MGMSQDAKVLAKTINQGAIKVRRKREKDIERDGKTTPQRGQERHRATI